MPLRAWFVRLLTRRLRKAREKAIHAYVDARRRNDDRDIGKTGRLLAAATSQLLQAERKWR